MLAHPFQNLIYGFCLESTEKGNAVFLSLLVENDKSTLILKSCNAYMAHQL